MICCLKSSSLAGDVVDVATGGGVADAVLLEVVDVWAGGEVAVDDDLMKS